mmetsp:Transcript_19389/g.29905  ORF Transcript_19389/g.29905 Transcript_19389/m.29905 type:complete len:155 (+) Transcript_19389:215-679(+)|eukprot:CAMPEP_0195283148 /NCGR_PEP_ID=MMETSP0707-20130614/1791_1 /TAXON_ID=33640 /ORGANISM="Asterionellopsis glacialis, Strain CCMP134" /LENGTH=154 /DNA_ID=CAMNT_0040342267 /DNA_START=273 /DNA_END=737 /DNA_ORIENTATION=+
MELRSHLRVCCTERWSNSQNEMLNNKKNKTAQRQRVRPTGALMLRRLEKEDPDSFQQFGTSSKRLRTYLILKPSTSLGITCLMLLQLMSIDSLAALGAVSFVSGISFQWNHEKKAMEEHRLKILKNIDEMELKTNILREQIRELESEIPRIRMK